MNFFLFSITLKMFTHTVLVSTHSCTHRLSFNFNYKIFIGYPGRTYLWESEKGSRKSGGYAEEVVHDILVSALFSHVDQHLVKVYGAHCFSTAKRSSTFLSHFDEKNNSSGLLFDKSLSKLPPKSQHSIAAVHRHTFSLDDIVYFFTVLSYHFPSSSFKINILFFISTQTHHLTNPINSHSDLRSNNHHKRFLNYQLKSSILFAFAYVYTFKIKCY